MGQCDTRWATVNEEDAKDRVKWKCKTKVADTK